MEPAPLDPPAGDGHGNLPLGMAAGLVAALLGAVLWAALVGAVHIKIGFAAVGVGFLVGWAIRRAGRGHRPVYGYAGVVLALFGCVAGDVLADCVVVSQQLSLPIQAVLRQLTPPKVLALLQTGFQPLDALFYLLAMRAGYRYAFRRG